MKLFLHLLACVAASFSAQSLLAQNAPLTGDKAPAEEIVEEIIVTSSYVSQALSEIENPLYVIDGQRLEEQATRSLGESLDHLPGIASSDYGAAVGQPVIRGLSGSRVRILNNRMIVGDAATLGADHANDIDFTGVEQVEIVRGPASLLYAKGAIGGIINLVDQTIAQEDFKRQEVRLGGETQIVNDGFAGHLTWRAHLGGVNLSAVYGQSNFGSYTIPRGSILDDEDADSLGNSHSERTSGKFGLSKTGDWGYVGLSYSRADSLYGVPFHGDAHAEESHMEDAMLMDMHEEEEDVFIETDSSALAFEGVAEFNAGALRSLRYFFRHTDFKLTEQHDEEGHAEDEATGTDEPEGTVFENTTREAGLQFDLSRQGLVQKVAVNFTDEEIDADGAEAYIPPVHSDEFTLGYYLSRPLSFMHADFGVRYGRTGRRTQGADSVSASQDDLSVALSLSLAINPYLTVNLGLASVARAPSAAELFSDGVHLARGRFETGRSDLQSERSNNLDLAFNASIGNFFANLTFFRNEVDDYIYLLDETDEEHAEHEEEDGHNHGDLPLAAYTQQDARLQGYEFEIGNRFQFGEGTLFLSYGHDDLSGRFQSGGNIPRLVPERNFYKIAYERARLKLQLAWKNVQRQNRNATGETETKGYDLLDVSLSKNFDIGRHSSLMLSLFGNNILNDTARNHTSFVKDSVPLPGRNYGLKLNLRF